LDLDASNIISGSLYRYADSAAVYRCPADQATVGITSATVPHTRSYSVEGWLAGDFYLPGIHWVSDKPKASTITTPGPSDIFAFIDEHARTIDDGIFVIGTNSWFDYPADRHAQGANLSFLDGHVEHKRWRSPDPAATGDAPAHAWLVARLPTQ
jgi:prepilin-type processing-associated H-X9-DG protein